MGELACFDTVQSGWADETLKFGHRPMASEMYETQTLMVLKAGGSSDCMRPYVQALERKNYIIVSVNYKIYYTVDKGQGDDTHSIDACDVIVKFDISHNCDWLVLCLLNGDIVIIEMTTGTQLQRHLVDIEEKDVNNFAECVFYHDSYQCLVVAKNGSVYKLQVNEISNETVFDTAVKFDFLVDTCDFKLGVLFVAGQGMLGMWNADGILHTRKCELSIKSCSIINSTVLALDTEGNLFQVSLSTLLHVRLKRSSEFVDFYSITNTENSSCQIFITTNSNELQLVSYPSGDLIYSIPLRTDAILVQSENFHDERLFISCINNNELRLCMVYETEPKVRLHRLLQRQMFDEAEVFVSAHNLSHIDILKAKAELIILQPYCSYDDVIKLINILDSLPESETYFKLISCAAVYCSDVDAFRTILEYGCNLNAKKIDHDMEEVLLKLNRQREELETLLITKQPTINVKEGTKQDQIEMIKQLLDKKQIEEATNLLQRLEMPQFEMMNEGDVSSILRKCDKESLLVYRPFLVVFLPLAVTKDEQPIIQKILKWTDEVRLYMEAEDPTNFPQNAISFIEHIVAVMLKPKLNDCSLLAFNNSLAAALDELKKHLKILMQLRTLHNNGIYISSEDFLQGIDFVVAHIFRMKLNPDMLKSFFEKSFLELISLHNFDPDQLLLKELELFILDEDSEVYWPKLVRALLSSFRAIETRLEMLKIVLYIANVPWCTDVYYIMNHMLNNCHNCKSKILDDIRLAVKFTKMREVLLNPLYGFGITHMNDDLQVRQMVKKIIRSSSADMIKDIKNICNTKRLWHIGNSELCKYFIERRDFYKMLEMLDDNKPDEIVRCCRFLLGLAEEKVRLNPDVHDPIYEILDQLVTRIDAHSSSKSNAASDCRSVIRIAQTVAPFSTELDNKLLFGDHKDRHDWLEGILLVYTEHLIAATISATEVFRQCSIVADCPTLPRQSLEDILLKLCTMSENEHLIGLFAKHLLDTNSVHTKMLCLAAVLLFKFEETATIAHSNYTFSDLAGRSPNAICTSKDKRLTTLRQIEALLNRALPNATDDLQPCLTVINWMDTMKEWLNNNIETSTDGDSATSGGNMRNARRTITFQLNTVHRAEINFLLARDIFNIYANFMGQFRLPRNSYLFYFDNTVIDTEEIFEANFDSLLEEIKSQCKGGNHVTVFRMLSEIRSQLSCVSPAASNIVINVMRRTCIKPMIYHILSLPDIDDDLLCTCFKSLKRKNITYVGKETMSKCARKPRQFEAVVNVLLRLNHSHQLSFPQDLLMEYSITAKWWLKLSSVLVNVQQRTFFEASSHERIQILLNCHTFDSSLLDLLVKICTDYELNVDESCSVALQGALLGWKPKGVDNKFDYVDLEVFCELVFARVDEKSLLMDCLNDTWTKVNFYHYEVFWVILKAYTKWFDDNSHTQKIIMLQFLIAYKRISGPGSMEKELWATAFPRIQSLDSLNKHRLPFLTTGQLFTNDILNVFTAEITLNTYTIWIKLVHAFRGMDCFSLSEDEVRSVAIKNVVSSNGRIADQFNCYGDQLISFIHECAFDIEDLQIATSALYHVIVNITTSDLLVPLAKLCYEEYALRYFQQMGNDETVEKAFVKVKSKYYQLAVTEILNRYGLATEDYTAIVTEPRQLVIALYNDSSICGNGLISLSKNVNNAAKDIASMFDTEVNLQGVHNMLLDIWLQHENDGTAENLYGVNAFQMSSRSSSTFHRGSSTRKQIIYNDDDFNEADEKAWRKAAYLCATNDDCSEKWFNYLRPLVNREIHIKDLKAHIRALKVLAYLRPSSEQFKEYTGLEWHELQNYMYKIKLLLLIRSYINSRMEMSQLDSYDKDALLNELRLSETCNKEVKIRIMALVCISNKLLDDKYWRYILPRLTQFRMLSETRESVMFLKSHNWFSTHEFFVNACQLIVDMPIEDIVSKEHYYSDDESLEQALIDLFLELPENPCVTRINMQKLIHNCIKLGKPEFAVIATKYMSKEKRAEFVKNIVAGDCTLISKLDDLQRRGIFCISEIISELTWYSA